MFSTNLLCFSNLPHKAEQYEMKMDIIRRNTISNKMFEVSEIQAHISFTLIASINKW
jgi:hypothetical protein